ncbi:MAG: rpfG 4 [Planctomycetaceae bacterium]|nr:rpfG 4 [Planctomycetaceae bacterium]
MNATAIACDPSKDRFATLRGAASGPPAAAALHVLSELRSSSIIRSRDWELLPADVVAELNNLCNEKDLLDKLVERQLVTKYQAERIACKTTFGLILGNYRVLDQLGSGGMGVVFKAEHLRLPRVVAIKLIPIRPDEDPRVQQRFNAEIWSIAQMQHPNIVGAIDAGETVDTDPRSPRLHYFVMDYVAGENLEAHIDQHGPVAPDAACDLIYQVASALTEAHKFNLVHRDIKPSNILVTPEGRAKLLDFGLVRHFSSRVTEPGTTLGTLDYLAPEQARDASSVDIRADIYGLGGTLYWCLTGKTPFTATGNIIQDLVGRIKQQPPSVAQARSGISPELDAIVAKMMATNPDDRYSTPHAVMHALMPFLRSKPRHSICTTGIPIAGSESLALPTDESNLGGQRILIVDDEPIVRRLCRYTLQGQGLQCDEAVNGAVAIEALKTRSYDLVISDSDMPEVNGLELLKRLRENPPSHNLKVIMFSGRASADEMAQFLAHGADDYLTKPLSISQFLSRVKAVLRLKSAQDRTELLNRHLLAVNAELEQNLTLRDGDLADASHALVLALAELVSYRDTESKSDSNRIKSYCRCLAKSASRFPTFADQLTPKNIQLLECCALLRDIGKVGVPDHILMKPGQLDPDERLIMQAHTTIGADTLLKVAQEHRFDTPFLRMAIDIARHHHERFDGKGYPDRLAGDDIPLEARIVAFVDVYDALRSRRPHKPPLSHAIAMQSMTESAPGQFDPLLWQAFRICAGEFERIAQGETT